MKMQHIGDQGVELPFGLSFRKYSVPSPTQ